MSHSFLRFVPVALGLSAVSFASNAEACSFAPSEAGTGVISRGTYGLPPLPRNVAFLWQHLDEPPLPPEGVTVAQGSDGEAIVAYEALDVPTVNGAYLVRPSEPLPANSAFTVYRYGSLAEQYQTGDYLDETPPERPNITSGALSFHDGTPGCGAQDSCGDYTSLSFELERAVTDDHALADDMVYALYLGESEAEVRAQTTPYAFLLSFGLNVDNGWMDQDAFIAVSALDHAGNESARSEPYRVNAGSDGEGCSVQSRSTRRVSGTLFLLAFGFAVLRRARTRR